MDERRGAGGDTSGLGFAEEPPAEEADEAPDGDDRGDGDPRDDTGGEAAPVCAGGRALAAL